MNLNGLVGSLVDAVRLPFRVLFKIYLKKKKNHSNNNNTHYILYAVNELHELIIFFFHFFDFVLFFE